MYKIGVCGHFGGEKNFFDGQTVKTKIITEELKKIYEIKIVDTFNGKKRIINILFNLFFLIKNSENIIILPAYNGLKIFVPFLSIFNKIFKKKLHYIVIGGWLSEYISDKKYLMSCLKKFDYIYVETLTMKQDLEKQGFKNIVIMPNCKNLKILKENELVYNVNRPYKLCTFSRVMQEKGIEDAIQAVKVINGKSKEIIYTLDIYGQIDKKYKERFNILCKQFPKYIEYKGVVPFDKSVCILKNYHFLLFPTLFYTEGIPGTIIDAYSAGIPVISSKWESFNDVVDEKVGIGYSFSDFRELVDILEYLANNPQKIYLMKKNCLKKAFKFDVKQVVREKLYVD